MELSPEAFAGFDTGSIAPALRAFPSRSASRGLAYFQDGRVQHLECESPGQVYRAEVRGQEDNYKVSLIFDEANRKWSNLCSCPVGPDCKHTYAAFKQLLAAHAAVNYQVLIEKVRSASAGAAIAPAPKAKPATFDEIVEGKLGRSLKPDETRYLQNIRHLFRQATGGGLMHVSDLTGLGLPRPSCWWEKLELYPAPPKTIGEFWNYLALYLTEKQDRTIPEFLTPVTDLASVREQLRRHTRSQDIEQWTETLAQLEPVRSEIHDLAPESRAVEIRLRFTPSLIRFEWQRPGGDWKELSRNRIGDFEARHGSHLSAESSLLWQAYCQRTQVQYSSNFNYSDNWVIQQIGRWLRLASLRPLLVSESGAPLVFHEALLRWEVTQSDSANADYSVRLIQANGEPVPKIWLITDTHPVYYLTAAGVFNGPPHEPHLVSPNKVTQIPAPALETPGGLRLLQRLKVSPPPRLADRFRNVKLLPGIRAEINSNWLDRKSDYCQLKVYGASEDGKHLHHWVDGGWMPVDRAGKVQGDRAFILLDHSAAAAVIPPLELAGFQWDFRTASWQLRISKNFPDIFVTFLKSLPPETRIDLAGEMAAFQNAEVAGTLRLEVSETETDWFDLRVVVNVSDATLTQEEIKLLLDAKGNWVRLDQKGWRKLQFNLSPEDDQDLARLGLTPHELTSEPQRLHAFQLADRAAKKFMPEETCAKIERRVADLKARVTPDVPQAIQAELRPYQREGFHFLAYLSENRFGGILADDMGLGKTLQAFAWLAWLRSSAFGQATGKSHPPSLVVCPKSVADNWHAESIKFAPSISVRVWSASDIKDLCANLTKADVHVINYSQLRSIGDELARERFLAIILDEGQYIKNPTSQTAQVARKLRSEHRLVLSGTPIENRLLDLWSLMNFAMPGILGTRAEFGRLYDSKTDPLARQRLSARVRPFLIRRTKAQVARDLPDRMEEDLFCELEGEQKTLYRAELKRAQALLLGLKTAAALNKQRFNFLTSLLRLRQICCHPRLVRPNSKAESAKVEALFETLEPLIAEGEKVLVFSQFVELLQILREKIQSNGWRTWYLAGDTENRGDLVRDFQSAEGAGVFLISLKAGGFGLNLTAASYVVLFDPWWNPAVENQAIDRTHRIGQTQKVIAYRLLIKDSIEEKIRALQKKKSLLANDVLGEEKFSQCLSLEDLRYLLTE